MHSMRKRSRANSASRGALLLEALEDRCTPSVTLTTHHGDNASTGQNPLETVLTPENVQINTFGKLFTTALDGQVYAQPLYMSNQTITVGGASSVHDVLYVATQHDSVYALDADSGSVLWHRSFIDPANGITTIPYQDVNSTDILPEIGITSTPVIDAANSTIYLVSRTKEIRPDGTHYVQTLHALDLASGADKLGGPAIIADTAYDDGVYTYLSGPWIYGTALFNVDGKVYYNALRQNQRPALTLANGSIYIASAGHADNGPYHGWVLSYDMHTMALNGVFCVTPNLNQGGGIWQSGGKLTVDETGDLYFTNGNGAFDEQFDANGFPINGNYGSSVIRLTVDPSSTGPENQYINGWGLKVVDYFTPYNQQELSAQDLDMGSLGALILPDSVGSAEHPHLMVTGGKEGRFYLIDRDDMGKFNPTFDDVVNSDILLNRLFGNAAYFNGNIYLADGEYGYLRSYSIADGMLNTVPTSQAREVNSFPGLSPTVSSNNGYDAILWAIDWFSNQLRAYDANNLAVELWNSSKAANSRDALGGAVKFTVPTVADGMVYVGAATGIVAYGLLSSPTAPPAAPSIGSAAISSSQVYLSWTPGSTNQDGYVLLMSTNGGAYSAIATLGPEATQYTVGGLTSGSVYSFRLYAFNAVGQSPLSNASGNVLPTTAGAGGYDFSAGFGSSQSQLALNGSAAVVGGALQLTSGLADQVGGAFLNQPVDVSSFRTEFRFQLSPAAAGTGEGFTFLLQPFAGALGAGGGGLGSQGIAQSIAIKFDLANNEGEGENSIGVYINGASPTVLGSVDLSPFDLDLHSGHAFQAAVYYSGGSLLVALTDVVTRKSATIKMFVDFLSVVGSQFASVGFTGATSERTAVQSITGWAYTPTGVLLPAAPANLTAAASGKSIVLAWNAVPGATSYKIFRGTSSGGEESNPIATGVTGAGYTDATVLGGTTYFYRVAAVNDNGTGPSSSEASATALSPPRTPTNGRPVAVAADSIQMAWNDVATNEDFYVIYRNNGAGTAFSLRAILAPNSTSYTDYTVQAGASYDYHILAVNNSGNSDFTGFTVTTLPDRPADLAAVGAVGKITLTWSPTQSADSYNVYRATTPEGLDAPAAAYATGVVGAQFVDALVLAGATYYYRVSAVNDSGEGAPSTLASAASTPSGSPPELTISGPTTATPIAEYYFTFTVADADPFNQAGDFTYQVDWNGDGTTDQTVVGASSLQIGHVFDQFGAQTVRATATSFSGLTSAVAFQAVDVTTAALLPNNGKNDLYYVAPFGLAAVSFFGVGDMVTVFRYIESNAIKYQLQSFAGVTGTIYAYSSVGDVLFDASALYGKSVQFQVGIGSGTLIGSKDGNSVLIGGDRNDILIGSGGKTVLVGNGGDDVLIGGPGTSWFLPGKGSDLVIAGSLNSTSLANDVYAIQAEWTSGRPFIQRVLNLAGVGSGPRSNGDVYIVPGQTVLNDHQVDMVLCTIPGQEDDDGASDWILFDPADDLVYGATDLDLLSGFND